MAHFLNLRKVSISKRLQLFTLLVVSTAIVLTGVISFRQASYQVMQSQSEKLSALVAARHHTLLMYLQQIEEDLKIHSADETVFRALQELQAGVAKLGGRVPILLHQAYIHDNPHPIGEKEKLNKAKDGSEYSEAHGRYHPWLNTLRLERDYYDIFLVNEEGFVVYTVFKELDFATHLLQGPYRGSNLSTVFRAVKNNPKRNFVAFSDFQPYAPSHGAPAAFIATPLVNDDGKFVGALIFQMPTDRINAVMHDSIGLGETGEIYLVGDDLLMRSDLRFQKETAILRQKVDTTSVHKSLAGETGIHTIQDYRNFTVLSAFQPLQYWNTRWAMVAEMRLAEVMEPTRSLIYKMVQGAVIVLLLATLMSLVIARSIIVSIRNVLHRLENIAQGQGDLTQRVDDSGQDEIGQMVQYFNQFTNKLQIMIKTINDHTLVLSESAQKLVDESQKMSNNAGTTAGQTNAVSAAAEQVSTNLQTIATGMEEMNASIKEIALHAGEAAKIAATAVQMAHEANGHVTKLDEDNQKINKVIRVINAVADQTNLLALNATIEAARAGEAGKGFAVVANEVKELAKETSKSTEDIGQKIEAIQNSTRSTVEIINQISTIIGKINDISSTIATAVEEQTATTSEISRNVSEAAKGGLDIAKNIASLADAAKSTSFGAGESQKSSHTLQLLAHELQKLLGQVKF